MTVHSRCRRGGPDVSVGKKISVLILSGFGALEWEGPPCTGLCTSNLFDRTQGGPPDVVTSLLPSFMVHLPSTYIDRPSCLSVVLLLLPPSAKPKPGPKTRTSSVIKRHPVSVQAKVLNVKVENSSYDLVFKRFQGRSRFQNFKILRY